MVTPLTASSNDRCSSVSRSRPALGPAARPPSAAPAAEQPAEEVAEVAQVVDPEGAAAGTRRRRSPPPKPPAAGPEAADLVVLLALVGVTEDVVGGGDLLEALLGAGVGVGVVLLGQLPVGAGDLLVGRRRTRPQDLVVVLFEPFALGGHGSGLAPHHHHGRTQHARPASGTRPASPRRPPARPPSTVAFARATASCDRGIEGSTLGRRIDPLEALFGQDVAQHGRAACRALASSDPARVADGPWPGRACRGPGAASPRASVAARADLVGLLLGHPLLVVLELGLQTAERVEVLVALGQACSFVGELGARPLRSRGVIAGAVVDDLGSDALRRRGLAPRRPGRRSIDASGCQLRVPTPTSTRDSGVTCLSGDGRSSAISSCRRRSRRRRPRRRRRVVAPGPRCRPPAPAASAFEASS